MAKTKTIDFGKAKVSQYVAKEVRKIESDVIKQLGAMNVPMFSAIKQQFSLEMYFLNHTDYHAILGNNIKLVDRAFMNAVANYVAGELHGGMTGGKKALGYTGNWDKQTLFNITADVITIMENRSSTELYFTALQFTAIETDADLNNAPFMIGNYMPFSDYNANKFYQIVLQIRAKTIEVVGGIIQNAIPKMFLHNANEQLEAHLCNVFSSYYENDIVEALSQINSKYDTDDLGVLDKVPTERMISRFAEYLDKPFMVMVADALKHSGCSQNIVNMVLTTSKLTIVYDDPAVHSRLGDVNFSIRLTSTVQSDDGRDMAVMFDIKCEDLVNMALADQKKGKIQTNGKNLRAFIIRLCVYAMNIYTAVIRANSTPDAQNAIGDILDGISE